MGVEDAQLVALSFQDGRELWRIPVPGRLDSPPTVADGRLYLGLRDGRVMALDASDGSPLWARAIGGPVWDAPVVVDGVLWVISRPTFLALDAEDGRVLREYAFRTAGNPVGAVVTGSTVAFSTSDKVLLFDRENLQQDYFYRLRGVTHLVASHDTIVATSSRLLISLDTNSRRPWWDGVRRWWGLFNIWGMAPEPPLPPRNWLVDSPGEHFSPVLTDTHVILALRERAAVYAYSLSKGVLDWVWEVPDTAIVAPPMLTPGGVVVLEEHALVLLDRLSGEERARHEFDDALRRVLITDHGTYLATDTAEVLAMR